jgi:AhpD family alkylhydroperoxidase
MQERVAQQDFYTLQPALPKALIAISTAVVESGIEALIIHLVKIRASQLNSCGFCLHMHHAEARRDGESQERLDILPAWRELPYFSERERAALEWTEALTLIAQGPVTDQVYSSVSAQFDETEMANLTAAIVEINSWNRIVAGFHFRPQLSK